MKGRVAGLVVVMLTLAWSAGLAGEEEGALQIVKTSIEGTSVIVTVENTHKSALVTGRCLGYFNNGDKTEAVEVSLEKIEPGTVGETCDGLAANRLTPR